MYTKEKLKEDLKAMGICKDDCVMVHSSMKAIGEVEGGAETVIDSFLEYLKDGLFLTPAHTWAQMSKEYTVFDPKTEPACVGIIPNLFLKRAGVVRSLHPTHSIAAKGKNAEEYIKGEENCMTPCPKGGCFDRLREVNAKILLIGVGHERNTFIHSIEEVYDVPERLTDEPFSFQIKMEDGTLKEVKMHRHFNQYEPHISERYVKLTEILEKNGATKRVSFGDADCILCDAKKVFEVVARVLEKEINCLMDRDEIPLEW